MPRIARIVVPGIPHHVTQRGNRRQQTFFREEHYLSYIDLMATWCECDGVEILAYCLMPNHVHLIAVPEDERGLARAVGEAHRRYTRMINFERGWRGHLWQGRFSSYAMDERHLLSAARYIEMNPVKAGLVLHPGDYPYSSARAHIGGQDDRLIKTGSLLGSPADWSAFLFAATDAVQSREFRLHERTGRPLGSEQFIAEIEDVTGRVLRKQRPGPKGRA